MKSLGILLALLASRLMDNVSIWEIFHSGNVLTRLDRSKHRGDTGKFGIEIARIGRILDLRYEWRCDLLVSEIIPVDVPKESMAHDLLSVSRSGS